MAKANRNKKKGEQLKVERKVVEQLPAWLVNRRWHGWLVFLFGALLYANTLGHEFAQDDAIVLYDNAFVKEGVSGMADIFRYDTFYGFFQREGKAKLVAGGRYRPFTLAMFALEVELFGVNPFIGHLINALLNGLLGLLIYRLLLLLLLPQKSESRAYFIALCTALLFVAHPVHTEAMANIKGRDEIMAMLGSLGGLYLSLLAMRRSRLSLHLAAGLVFLVGLLSKENAITFVAVAPLTYYFFTSSPLRQIAGATLPFLVAALVFLFIRTSVLGSDFGAPTLEMMNNPFVKVAGNQYVPFSSAEKTATITYSLGKYLQLLFYPHPLTHDYYPRAIGVMQWGDWRVLVSFLAYVALMVYALRGVFRRDLIAYGILFYLITLSIVSNILFPVGTHMAERLLFMPSLGFCLAVVGSVYQLSRQGKAKGYQALYPALAVVGVAVLAFGARTVARNTVWENNYTLFTNDIQNSPGSAKLRNAVGGELLTHYAQQPEGLRDPALLQEAEGHLLEAIKIHPNYKNAYLLLGNCNYYQREYDEAIRYYQIALGIDAGYQEAQDNLFLALREAGKYQGEERSDIGAALNYLQQAYQMKPEDFEVNRLLGVAYGVQGNTAQAIAFLEKSLQIKPDDASTWLNLSSAYFYANMPDKAAEARRRAQELNPDLK